MIDFSTLIANTVRRT